MTQLQLTLGWDEVGGGREWWLQLRQRILTSTRSFCGSPQVYWALSPAQPGEGQKEHLMGR